MSPLITLDSVAVATPDGRPLFSDLTVAFSRERTGLVGRNGAGKSSLLQVLDGTLAPAAGAVSRFGTLGRLRQDPSPDVLSVSDQLGVSAQLARLRRLEAGDGAAADLADADWGLEARVGHALERVGLHSVALDRELQTLSGGERTRLAIARILVEAPDFLLLDEPTNNLDAQGRALVADLVRSWRGGVVLASHDRELLEGVDRILALTSVDCQMFGGPWSAFEGARAAAQRRAAAELDRAEGELRQTQDAVQRQRERKARRDKAGRAWRAKGIDNAMFLDAEQNRAERSAGREGHLADRLLAEAKAQAASARDRIEVVTPLRIELPGAGLPSGRELIRCEAVTFCRGDRRILGPLSMRITGPERVAVRGSNGAGKTTLLQLACGRLQPASGQVIRTGRFALLDQHLDLLDPTLSLAENLRRMNPECSDNEARSALARFAFRNSVALREVASLSGGERLRAALACLFSSRRPPQLLLLDEPTNHLDLESTLMLESCLSDYDGALLVASHDSRFVAALEITKTVDLESSN